MKPAAATPRLWVLKVGSALLSPPEQAERLVRSLAEDIARLRADGLGVILVSSGSVACGMGQAGVQQRPSHLPELQALSALGQLELLSRWDQALRRRDLRAAQVLLCAADIENRTRYLNARNAVWSIIRLGAIPIVNENDAVATEELCFGDNDRLAGSLAALMRAQRLVLFTDQQGMHHSDPRKDPDAPLLREAVVGDPRLDGMAGPASVLGRGGMVTKLAAARQAALAGADTWIIDGREPGNLGRLADGETLGTHLRAPGQVSARRGWIGSRRPAGTARLDQGALRALRNGRSLLPIGVTAVEGDFQRGDVLRICDPQGTEVGLGLSNYDMADAKRILGCRSERLSEVLGRITDDELVHRDNLILHGEGDG